ncbi:MAG: hypothetical protein K2H93_05600 [Oscillospiraceae bacterium]|nr:hypothetical protein [Ruminococcus sp.]MDE5737824.1 hypothetical protein [Oscillospiraceae bacterium]MDE6708791.1 hypothetical protein [Oscillospiraceae bacterium]
MLRKFWNKYKENFKKDILVHILVIVGILGILCILLSSCFESSQEQPETQESEHAEISQEAYRLQLQEQLAEMLGNITGVGKVEVLVTIQGSEAYHYAQEADSRYVTVGGSQKEALVESVSHPEITGVVVACEGGGKSTVQETVYQAVSVACGLRTAQIYVTQLEQTAIRKES